MDRGYLQICHIQVEDHRPKDGPLRLKKQNFPSTIWDPSRPKKINEYITPYFLPIFFFYFETEKPKRASVEGMADTSPPKESIAILIRDESDINIIKEMFGEAVLLSIYPVTSRDQRSMKDLFLLENTPVRCCFIIVESTKLEEELLTKSSSTVYQDLLKTANRIVGKNISSHYSLRTSLLYPEIQEKGKALPLPLFEFETNLL